MQMKAVKALEGRCALLDVAVPAPADRQVLLRVHATAMNRADTLQRRGVYPPPPGATDVMGLEAAGVVVRRGPGCVGPFGPGARVMALLPGGGFADYVVVDERHLLPVPAEWLTAFQLLHLVGHVSPADRVLVHAAGSGVGTALCQLAKLAGAQVFATASAGKLTAARHAGAHVALDREDWCEPLKRLLGEGGISLILDPVGASYAERNIAVAEDDCRWVLYGLMGGAAPPASLLSAVLRKRIALRGSTLRHRSDAYKAQLVQEFVTSGMLDKLERGALQPVMDTRGFHGLEACQDALDYLETNQSIGKVCLRVKL
jgi:tumor protein p53-inducible protein 3